MRRSKFLHRTGLLACSRLPLGAPAETLQQLLADRPAFPEIPWAQEIDETAVQHHARISGWENNRATWVLEMAAIQNLSVRGTSQIAPPGLSPASWILVAFTADGDPIYEATMNTEAATSTQALVRREGI